MPHHRNVYVVDDDTSVRTSLFFAMSPLGYTVRPSSSGREFLDDAVSLKPGCVLLDLRMPEIDGIEVIKALGSRIASLPVILMTDHGDIGIAVQAMKLGASDSIEKPVDHALLIEAVDRVFGALESRKVDNRNRISAQQTLDTLSVREREVLDCLASGLSNKGVAAKLGLSVRTVEMHRLAMMQRLRVASLPQALRINYLALSS